VPGTSRAPARSGYTSVALGPVAPGPAPGTVALSALSAVALFALSAGAPAAAGWPGAELPAAGAPEVGHAAVAGVPPGEPGSAVGASRPAAISVPMPLSSSRRRCRWCSSGCGGVTSSGVVAEPVTELVVEVAPASARNAVAAEGVLVGQRGCRSPAGLSVLPASEPSPRAPSRTDLTGVHPAARLRAVRTPGGQRDQRSASSPVASAPAADSRTVSAGGTPAGPATDRDASAASTNLPAAVVHVVGERSLVEQSPRPARLVSVRTGVRRMSEAIRAASCVA